MQVICQCETISFAIPSPTPLDVYHCHCLECQKQSSSAFGTSAIFPAEDIFPLSPDVEANLGKWTRPANARRTMDCYFCKECGSRVMHRIREPDGTERGTVSVKGGLVQGLEWSGAKHIYTRTAVVPIPEGVVRYEGAPPAMPGRKDGKEEGENMK
ncbi:Mss4-like protein [Podospora australis]|uniref:Mss4-like protein n=1 Tax=Podospora australis TaxID=1536484 RepID=A0AAN6WJ41_9PEZI|nr:Mss4-like protein [Podospora australis]